MVSNRLPRDEILKSFSDVKKGSKQHIRAETNTHKRSPASAVQDDKL